VATCKQCGGTVGVLRLIGNSFVGVDCGCAGGGALRREAGQNPYGDLRLDHIHGEDGKPIRVTSSRQLSAAEQRYNFASVVRNMDSQNIDRAPVQKPMTVGDIYRRKFVGGR
jgi:hypothetical protein